MKRIPAGLATVLLVFGFFSAPARAAEESAQQLAEETGLGGSTTDTEQSAAELATQSGLQSPAKDNEESAAQLADQTGGAISTTDNEESAAQLAAEQGGSIGTTDTEQSAQQLLEQQEGITPTPSPSASGGSAFAEGGGVNGTVFAATAQPDGKIVIGGRFNSVNTKQRSNLARLDADGSLDATFLPKVTDGLNGSVFAVAIDSKGGILAGGLFSLAQETPRYNLVRYLPDGTLDKTFNAGNGPNGKVLAIAIQPDGSIVIGGEFSQVGTEQRRNLARFNADGTLAAALTGPDGTTGSVLSLAVLPDGNVVAGGTFQISGQVGRNILKTGN